VGLSTPDQFNQEDFWGELTQTPGFSLSPLGLSRRIGKRDWAPWEAPLGTQRDVEGRDRSATEALAGALRSGSWALLQPHAQGPLLSRKSSRLEDPPASPPQTPDVRSA